jgi:phospholipase A1
MIRTLLLACFLLAWLCGAQGYAAETLVDNLVDCSNENDPNKRLACFEKSLDKCSSETNREKRLQCFDKIVKKQTPAAEVAGDLAKCSGNDAERLRCYDQKADYSWWECRRSCSWWTPSPPRPGLDGCRETCDDSERLVKYDTLAGLEPPEESSYLEKLWLLDPKSLKKEGRWAILPHRENYFLLYTYNGHLDKQPYESVNPGTNLQDAEAKFQLSLKMKLWEDIFGDIFEKKVDLWVGYTQLSLWQLWNWNYSAPFRETNYEPEAIFNVRMDKKLFDGWKLQFIQFVPINHQSNGQSEPLSRSWNRSMLNFGVEKVKLLSEQDNFDVLLKTWYRWPESAENDDNPNIESYLGYGELWAGYHGKRCGHDFNLSLMFRNNLRFDDENRSTLQLGLDFTLIGPLNFYIQYFTGYGETLIDYNHYTNRIGVGVMIQNW